MYELGGVCAHLKTCRPEAGLSGSAAIAKVSQHPYHAKAVTEQRLSSHRFTAKAPGVMEHFQMYST